MANEDFALLDRKPGESRYTIESVMKTLQILFSFCEPPYRFLIGELESATGLSKNQIFRSLKSLEEFGLLRIDTEGYYVITAMAYNLALAAEPEAPLEEVAQPIMDQLQRTTGETVNLCVKVDGQSTIIARRHSKQGVRLVSRLGERTTLTAGANPKAILAYLPKEEQEKILGMLPHYQKMTEKTQTNPDLLRLELEEIRRLGYSTSLEDYEMGAIGAGAPIFGKNGEVIGAISAGGPTNRVKPADLAGFGQLVMEAANRISRILGYIPRGE